MYAIFLLSILIAEKSYVSLPVADLFYIYIASEDDKKGAMRWSG